MRPDVKLGVIFSVIGVLVGGGYFMYRDGSDASIPVGSKDTAQAKSAEQVVKPGTSSKSAKTKAASPSVASRRIAAKNSQRNPGASKSVPVGAKEIKKSPSKAAVPVEKTAEQSVRADPRKSVLADADKASDVSALTRLANNGRRGVNRNSGRKPEGGSKDAGSRAVNPPKSNTAPAGKDAATRVADRTQSRSSKQGTADAVHGRTNSRPVSLAGIKPASNNGTTSTPGGVAVDTHLVRSGDTFAALSQAYYGTVRYSDFLISSNPHVPNPRSLAIGSVIKIPPRPVEASKTSSAGSSTRGSKPATSTARTHTVRPGESFYAIARDQLGDSSRWEELFELNKDLVHGDPKRLQVGQELKLPN